jgi:hypothetical protein
MLADGSLKHVIHVKKGDVVCTDLSGHASATDEVECVVRTHFVEGATGLVRLAGGWLGTPHHPVMHNGQWTHPKHLGAIEVLECEYTYSMLFKRRSPTMVVNGWVRSDDLLPTAHCPLPTAHTAYCLLCPHTALYILYVPCTLLPLTPSLIR